MFFNFENTTSETRRFHFNINLLKQPHESAIRKKGICLFLKCQNAKMSTQIYSGLSMWAFCTPLPVVITVSICSTIHVTRPLWKVWIIFISYCFEHIIKNVAECPPMPFNEIVVNFATRYHELFKEDIIIILF